ncbi:MAG TPA: GDP-mannose 4,6-dehydratase [Streptosporangiaceae bacterium]|jgi:GDPmannose 4,6-dehydratase
MTEARRALITGVTGQDGWYLSRLLLADGYQVYGLVHNGDTAPIPEGVLAIPGDLTEAADVRQAVMNALPDEIYNLGGVSSVALSWDDPLRTAEVTGLGFLRVITAVRALPAERASDVRIVQASSAEMFGAAAGPQTEQSPLAPITPYGAAKAFAHHLARLYRGAGLSISTAILYNHESPRRPETFVTRKITRVVARIAQGEAERLSIGNLETRRDWGYAGDYARALQLIARHRVADDFVVASGETHSVADFVATAFRRIGVSDWQRLTEIDPQFRRPADAPEQRGDARKIRQELGWRPTKTFEDMVNEMVDADLGLLDASQQQVASHG